MQKQYLETRCFEAAGFLYVYNDRFMERLILGEVEGDRFLRKYRTVLELL